MMKQQDFTISATATRTAFAAAVAEYAQHTCVDWVARNVESDFVKVEDAGAGSGCFSYVGRVGGNQTLNLQQTGCVSVSSSSKSF